MNIKLYGREIELRRFKYTNFCMALEKPLCVECSKDINNEDYFYLCKDHELKKIWHEEHFVDNHGKKTWDSGQHHDILCVFKLVTQETFDSFDISPILLK